jgi:GAF domain-containing protein
MVMAHEKLLYNILEQHKKNKDISKKIYRYTGLIHAIEFFTLKFNLDYIDNYIYEFSNELLLPDQIAVFIKKNSKYELMYSKGYDNKKCIIYYDKSYDEITRYHSGLFTTDNLKEYFPREVLQNFPSAFAIPLIMNRELYGIIFVNRLTDQFVEDDIIIANTLMNLYSTALTNHKYYGDLMKVSKQLNEKVFNLFAINHSSRVLLSELDIEILYNLSISVFSELTQSSFTTFFLYDNLSESYRLMSLKDVHNSNLIMFINLYPILPMESKNIRILTDMSDEKQRKQFYSLFRNSEEILKDIKAMYIVSLKKDDKLIGFVTLGPKVNDTEYEDSIFELIESLASSTYIAISNASKLQKINSQKEIINNKLNRLVKLNLLMKNINTAKNREQLIELTLSTLSVFFGVTSGFVGLYNEEKDVIDIRESINISNELKEIIFTNELLPLRLGENVVLNSELDVENTFSQEVIQGFDNNYCGALLVPIFVDDNELKLLGVIGILAIKDKIIGDEENIITLESISSHIAPVLYQFDILQNTLKLYKPDYQVRFINDLEIGITEAIDFYLELKVIHINIKDTFTFNKIEYAKLLTKEFKKVYPVDNMNIFVITCEKNPIEIIMRIVEKANCKQYELGKDFNSLEDFLQKYN